METIGLYCDECRTKYVRHKCKDGLPCGHSKNSAIEVYAKHYARGCETVILQGHGFRYRLELTKIPRQKGSYSRHEIWSSEATIEDQYGEEGPMQLALWLHLRAANGDEHIVRAFMERWESADQPPQWRRLSMMDFQEQAESA